MAAEPHGRSTSEEERCYRLRSYYFYVGVVCGAFFVVIGSTSTAVAYWNIDGSFPHPKPAAAVVGAFWSGFTLLAGYIVAAYYRGRLYLSASRVVQRGVFRERTICVPDVGRVVWRSRPVGGSVVIRTDANKVVVEFANYTRADRSEIAGFIRERFRTDIQEGWPSYQERWDRPPEPAKPPSRTEAAITASIFLCLAAAFVWCWSTGFGVRYLALGGVNLAFVAFYLWRGRRSAAQK